MAYTLKSSGIATNLAMCVAVDSDGTTIKDFVAGITITAHANVTRGSSSWKGSTRYYFETTGTGGFTANALAFTGPSLTFVGTGLSCFFAMAGMGAMVSSTTAGIMTDSIATKGWTRSSLSGPARWGGTAGTGTTGVTSLPTDGTTKFSTGGNCISSGTTSIYYGLESGSLAQDSTGTDTNGPTTFQPTSIGGLNGQGYAPGKYHIACLFNRPLTLVEHQSLHDGWFGTLFDAPADISASGSALTVGAGTAPPTLSIGL